MAAHAHPGSTTAPAGTSQLSSGHGLISSSAYLHSIAVLGPVSSWHDTKVLLLQLAPDRVSSRLISFLLYTVALWREEGVMVAAVWCCCWLLLLFHVVCSATAAAVLCCSIMEMDPNSAAFQRIFSNVFAYTAFKSTEPWLVDYVTLDLHEAMQQVG